MTGGGPGAPSLERGYRRLLACYPPRHRRARGEEMVGVLLAAAPAGQRRPTGRETADLLRGAARIWLAPRSFAAPARGWRDALAVVSIALPLIMALRVVAETAGLAAAIYPERIYVSLTSDVVSLSPLSPGLVILLVVLRLRRTAAAVTLVLTAVLLAQAIRGAGAGLDSSIAFAASGYAVETVALAGSAGPRRGLRLMTWRGIAVAVTGTLAVAAFCAAVTAARMPVIQLPGARPSEASPSLLSALAAAAGVVVLAAAAAAARSGTGRRVLVLLAVPGCVLPAGLLTPWPGTGTVALVSYLPPLALAAGIVVAARRAARPGAGRAS
ncbi:MAG TPA: hypothetical protein VGG35_16335 [Streptosporangiaceae bacterium]